MKPSESGNRSRGDAEIEALEAERPQLWIPLRTVDYALSTRSGTIREIIQKLCPGDTPLSANKLSGLIGAQLKERGAIKEVHSLGIGLPRGLPELPGVKEGLLNVASNPRILETYPPTLGLDSTREVVAESLTRKSGKQIQASEVAITHGAENALHVVLSTILKNNPQQEVLFIGPGFPTYALLVGELEGKATYSATHRKPDGDYELDLNDVKNQITPRTRALLLSSPGNPTGHMVRKTEFEELIALARQHDFKLIVDDPYSFVIFDHGEYCDPLTLFPDAKDVLVIIHSASKQYGIPGARVGYTIGEEKFLSSTRVSQDCSVLAASTPGMKVLEAILEDPSTPDVLGKRFEELRLRRELTMSRFSKLYDLFEVSWPKATYYCFARLKLPDNNDLSFCLRLLEEAGVIVLPGSGFGPSGRGFVRFCFGYTQDEINTAFDAIDTWWAKNREKPERQ